MAMKAKEHESLAVKAKEHEALAVKAREHETLVMKAEGYQTEGQQARFDTRTLLKNEIEYRSCVHACGKGRVGGG